MADRRGSNWTGKRNSIATIPIAINNLIICCGVSTEVNYFQSITKQIKESYPKITGINFDIIPCAVDPLNMARAAEGKFCESKSANKPYQHVWIVFDKDDFTNDNFGNAINKLNALNKKYANDEVKFHSLWSNECIELWFLLHFCFLNSAIHRASYFDRLSDYLGHKYKKNNQNIVGEILIANGRIENAITNAKKLIEYHGQATPANSNPATNVYEFFEFYRDYLGLL